MHAVELLFPPNSGFKPWTLWFGGKCVNHYTIVLQLLFYLKTLSTFLRAKRVGSLQILLKENPYMVSKNLSAVVAWCVYLSSFSFSRFLLWTHGGLCTVLAVNIEKATGTFVQGCQSLLLFICAFFCLYFYVSSSCHLVFCIVAHLLGLYFKSSPRCSPTCKGRWG